MASILGDTTCAIHSDRRSVARCPSCRRYFCPECITEHDGKLVCATCLGLKASTPVASPKRRLPPVAAAAQFLLAVAVIWVLYYFFAQTLSDIPDEFHDGTIWE